MPGEQGLDSAHSLPEREGSEEASAVQCPVHRVAITPCDSSEITPLLEHLDANLAVQGSTRFPRGTLIDDGRLDLCKQSLGTENCLRIARALRGNTRVKSLMLGTNAIGDTGAVAVAQLACVNSHLEVLYLGCNNIGPEGARLLGATLEREGQRLTGLWLKRNPLGPEGAASIAQMVRDNRQLRVLDLVNTDLRDAGVRTLVDAICSGNNRLQSLYLSGNALGPATAPTLARLLREAQHLKALYLSVNRLGDEGVVLLADGLRGNRSLQILELASNGIGAAGAKALFAAVADTPLHTINLGYAPSTKVLGAEANCLGDEGARAAADFIAGSTCLRKLDVVRNGMTGNGLAMLIEAARGHGQMSQLEMDGVLPADLVEQLRAVGACSAVPALDQDLIKSVYR